MWNLRVLYGIFFIIILFQSFITAFEKPLYNMHKTFITSYLHYTFQVNGRIDSYKRFKAMLLVELSHVFPNEMTRYRAVREELS